VANELILIVEDNPRNLKLLRDTLQVKGYQTIEAGTGEEGVQLAREAAAEGCAGRRRSSASARRAGPRPGDPASSPRRPQGRLEVFPRLPAITTDAASAFWKCASVNP